MWTTSFLWYQNLYHVEGSLRGEISARIHIGARGRPDRPDRPQVAELRLDHAVDLFGQIRLAGGGTALEDVVHRLGAADHDGARRVGRRPVRRHAFALEELDLVLEDPADVVRGQRRRDV